MLIRLLLLIAIGAAILARPVALRAQEVELLVPSDTLREIRLIDGSVLIGRVVTTEGDRITIETSAGARVEVERSQIRSISDVRGRVVDGQVWSADPNSTRLFFGPTARALGAGAGYFGVFELFFPYVSYGVTDRIALSGGTPIFPGFVGQVFYLAPKITVASRPGWDVAAGVLALFATEALDQGSVGLIYGVSTWGEPDRAVTFGAGVPFATSGEDPITDELVLMGGAELRAGRRTKFITENYLFPAAGEGIASGGVRFFGESLSADAGVGLFLGNGNVGCCLPIVNFVYSFGPER